MNGSGRRGRTYENGDKGFEEAVKRSSFSVHDSGRRPDIVCQANDAADVQEAVRLASAQNLRISICSGGHSWSQNHIREGGLLIDLSRLNGMVIDAAKRTAIVEPGLHGGDFDMELAEHGLLFPVAHAYGVGLGGFLLQGGYGWNSRMLGLACESVVGIDVVLADGRLVHANERENSDLFWAARGAGVGFFAVVVRFYLRLHDRPKYIALKMQVFRIRHLEEVLLWFDSIKGAVSPKVEFQAVFNRKAFGIFSHGIEVVACVLADSRQEAKKLLEFVDTGPVRRKASFTFPLLRLSISRIMKIGEKVMFPANFRWFTDNIWMTRSIGPALPTIRQMVDSQPDSPSHAFWQIWNPVTRQRPDMAFSMEGLSYIGIYGALRPGRGSAADEQWATNSAAALAKFGSGIQLSDENLARRPADFMAPANFDRLQRIRAEYDPEGRFYSYGRLPAEQ